MTSLDAHRWLPTGPRSHTCARCHRRGRVRRALARALDVLLSHGPVELLRRIGDALLGWAFRGWWP